MRQTSSLISRNIRVDGRRTSVRLEASMWDALKEICQRQNLSVHAFCERVERDRGPLSLTAAIRVAIVSHYRRRATVAEAARAAPAAVAGAASARGAPAVPEPLQPV